ncbi:MAG: hypothetical protein N2235_19620 [Fischerella sp.]|nr:hypothetical protein [Fischerella sp.]
MKIINLPKHLSIVASLCIACQAIITKMPYTVNLDGWTDKTATAIEAQFSDNNFAGTLPKSNF